jgi:hypothetical protein
VCFVFAVILQAPKAEADSTKTFDVSGTATDFSDYETTQLPTLPGPLASEVSRRFVSR